MQLDDGHNSGFVAGAIRSCCTASTRSVDSCRWEEEFTDQLEIRRAEPTGARVRATPDCHASNI